MCACMNLGGQMQLFSVRNLRTMPSHIKMQLQLFGLNSCIFVLNVEKWRQIRQNQKTMVHKRGPLHLVHWREEEKWIAEEGQQQQKYE